MSIKKIMDTLKMLEEQRRLADPFYADLGDRENVLLKRLKEVTRADTGRHAKMLDRLEISLDALRLKCQETKYRFKQIQQLIRPITDRTFDRTIVTKDGIKVRASLGIDSDSVAFEFDAFLQVAKSACDKLAEVARALIAAEKGVSDIRGLRGSSIHDFVKSARKLEASSISSKMITAWDSWIKDLNDCRDFVEHHGRYFTYSQVPNVDFPITVPPPKYLQGLTRARINSLSIDELPPGNISLTLYCQQTVDRLEKLVLDILEYNPRGS